MPRGIYKRIKTLKLTEEHKKNISEALIGRKHSKETRKKIGDGNRGKKHSEESKIIARQRMMGKKYRLGKLYTKELKDRMRIIKLLTTPRGENSWRWIKDRNLLKVDR